MSEEVTEVLVIDSKIPNFTQIMGSVPAHVEVKVLSGEEGALAEISDFLEGFTGLKAIHLFSHAENGSLSLGRESLGKDNVDAYEQELNSWQAACADGADLLVYGCDMAGETVFLESLAGYTGMDVAASDDVTGAAKYGGDSELENHLGEIEAVELFDQGFYDQFQLKLAQVEYTGGNTSNNLNTFINNNINDGDTLVFNSAVTINFSSEIILDKSVLFVNSSGGEVVFDGAGNAQLFDLDLSSNETTSFDGFVFRNAYSGDGGDGGAIEMRDGNVIIKNSIFDSNTANDDGGAIQMEDGNLLIQNTTFNNNNSGDNGGALDVYLGELVILNSNFTNNEASDDGGAISTHSSSVEMVIVGSDFDSNTAGDDGGAIDKDGPGVLTIEASSFTDNSVTEGDSNNTEGGAINAEGGITNINSSTFVGNSGEQGSALNSENNNTVINVSNSVFEGNFVVDENGDPQASNNTGDGSDTLDAVDSGVINVDNSPIDGENITDSGGDDENFNAFATPKAVVDEAVASDAVEELDGFVDADLPGAPGGATDDEIRGVDFFGEVAGDRSGEYIEGVGDVNNDGFDDFLIGSAYHSSDSGAVYLIFGADDLDYTDLTNVDETYNNGDIGVKINGIANGDKLAEVGALGDFNGDGIDDFALGARNADGAVNNSGAAYVIYGTETETAFNNLDLANLVTNDLGFVIKGEFANDDLGWQVTSAGDFNGDGYADALISADLHDANGSRSGAVYVVYGDDDYTTDLDLTQSNSSHFLEIQGGSAGDFAGYSVAEAGDVNGDGFDDIIIGAPYADYVYGERGEGFGAAYVIFGSENSSALNLGSLGSEDGFKLFGKDTEGNTDGLEMVGSDVSSAGDFNGDGFADILLGSPGKAINFVYDYDESKYTYTNNEKGNIFVIFGSETISETNLNEIDPTTVTDNGTGILIKSERAGDYAGLELSAVGDVNGDGFDDILFASSGPYDDLSVDLEGKVYLIFGSALPNDYSLEDGDFYGVILEGIHDTEAQAAEVDYAGDVDGDGFDDILIGEYFVTGNIDPDNVLTRSSAGDTYLIFGGNYIAEITNYTSGSGDGVFIKDNFVGDSSNNIFSDVSILDSVSAGAGDDTIEISSGIFEKIDGGSGYDTLRLDMDNNGSLDLTNIENRLESIEKIDMQTGNNTDYVLGLDLRSMAEYSDRGSVMKIDGNSSDSVTIDGLSGDYISTDIVTGPDSGYTLYSYNVGAIFAEVQIQTDIAVSFI
ncbi:DUF4347 domain-containing protein [Lentisphaera profundi]|uniref:DUF4347 domain-containing protein n=1 Tax=Lentisphaera profundi TaxID=1658616 RepID=A0ABY7VVM0_9BACT|nr:DUF4347 domain-containing protein [Lentisphaera profundi]WDE98117.1 DUF4347 domain-containing protein [Lentisphaera profundi]